MNWNDIVGQKVLISSLKDAIENDRVAHAQLFVGKEGYGGLPLVLAYAQEIFPKLEKDDFGESLCFFSRFWRTFRSKK